MSDCDGYTSSAFMINWLYRMFPSFTANHVSWKMHQDKGHGLLIDHILKTKPQLVICPDAGSNEYELHKLLKENNIDLIIIDHHNAEKYSEDAIVINNQLDAAYPTKSLSGVGMVFKFCSYMDQLLGTNEANNLLDITALGVIADVMDLRDYETKRLVNKGLSNIENPFIKAMVAKNDYSLKGEVTADGVAWYIAPAVNAVTRVGTDEEKERLFDSMLDSKAYTLVPSTKRGHSGEEETIVEQACRICTNVKNRQSKVRDQLSDEIDDIIKSKNLVENKIIAVKIDEPTEDTRSITGLVANKLMSKYQHPIMLLNKTHDENGNVIWAGSGRNNPLSGLASLQEFAKDSGYVTLAEGHDNALGIAIPDENFAPFIEYANEKLSDVDFRPTYRVDLEYLPGKIDEAEILELADSKRVWGQGVSEPLVVLKDVAITKESIHLFNTTLKIDVPNTHISLVKFRSSQEEYDSLYSATGCIFIDVVGTCKRNSGWDDSPEIIITDYEIKKQQQWYF